MRFIKLYFLLIVFFLARAFNIFSAQDDIAVKVEVDKAFATIGDEINFRVTVHHPPEISLLEIDTENALSDFEIKKVTNFSTREDKIISEGKNYLITTYLLGEYVIKPFKVKYRAKDGAVKEIMTNSLYLTMESVDKNKSPESDIRGVKGVYKLKNPIYLWTLAIALIGTAGGAGYWWYSYKKRRRLTGEEREPALSAHEEAYLALNQLKHSDLIRKGFVKQYFFQMSEILRRYLERRFHIRALESTTCELMNDLKRVMNQEQAQWVDDLLSFCDLVKFAKYVPTPLEIIQESNQAKTIIDRTKEEPQLVLSENTKTT